MVPLRIACLIVSDTTLQMAPDKLAHNLLDGGDSLLKRSTIAKKPAIQTDTGALIKTDMLYTNLGEEVIL